MPSFASSETDDLSRIADRLNASLAHLSFAPPVTHVYNPLIYARGGFDQYIQRYGRGPKQVLLVGMNPGPWGMAQTGVPFGDPPWVRSWLNIEAAIETPAAPHPKRPVEGFASRRREVSGRRVWRWASERFNSPERFFQSFFIANYCPLMFMEESGRNRTPDKLPLAQRKPLLAACDEALRRTVALLQPKWVIGIGAFAAARVGRALTDSGVNTGRITHPSPANPKANRGWAELVDGEFVDMGLGGLLP